MTTSSKTRDLSAGAAVGARVHAILWTRRQTQAALAARLGITATTLSKKLRGTVPLTVDELVRVADHLGVGVGVLLGTSGDLDPGALAEEERHAAAG